MAKKSFEGVDSFTEKPKYVTKENLMRVTFMVDQDIVETIRAIADQESYHRTLKEKKLVVVRIHQIASEAFQDYIEKYEKQHGQIKRR